MDGCYFEDGATCLRCWRPNKAQLTHRTRLAKVHVTTPRTQTACEMHDVMKPRLLLNWLTLDITTSYPARVSSTHFSPSVLPPSVSPFV